MLWKIIRKDTGFIQGFWNVKSKWQNKIQPIYIYSSDLRWPWRAGWMRLSGKHIKGVWKDKVTIMIIIVILYVCRAVSSFQRSSVFLFSCHFEWSGRRMWQRNSDEGDANPPLLSGWVIPWWRWMPSFPGSGGKGVNTGWNTFKEGLGLQRKSQEMCISTLSYD